MRDHDEVPHIIIERDGGGGFGSFVLGALVGAGLALLFAPKTGEETQEELKERAKQLRSSAESHMRDVQKQLEEKLDVARVSKRPSTLVERRPRRPGEIWRRSSPSPRPHTAPEWTRRARRSPPEPKPTVPLRRTRTDRPSSGSGPTTSRLFDAAWAAPDAASA
jgi:hypothetical protein